MTKRAAIILSGGKAHRFQNTDGKWQDKALAKLYGKPLLVHAVENAEKVVDDIVVVVNEEARKSEYKTVLADYNIGNIRVITDLKINHLSGPIIAILTGLKFVQADYCLTIPSDMPFLNRKVADYLFSQIPDSYVAVPMWPNSRIETLLMVLERTHTLQIVETLCHLGRSHPDDIIRGSLHVLLVSSIGEIKTLDPELKSFININCQEDLNRLQPRQGHGSIVENLRLNLGILPTKELQRLLEASFQRNSSNFSEASTIFSACSTSLENENSFFWAAISREHEAKSLLSSSNQQNKPELINDAKAAFLKAARNYRLEANAYQEQRCCVLAERANSDKTWCEMQSRNLAIK
jgi:molybdopterin-guanine dinucleotide biosynthesis protein A